MNLDNAFNAMTTSNQQFFLSLLAVYVNPLSENFHIELILTILGTFGVDLSHIPFEVVANWYDDVQGPQSRQPRVVITGGISTGTFSTLTVGPRPGSDDDNAGSIGHSAGSTDPTTNSSGSSARSDEVID